MVIFFSVRSCNAKASNSLVHVVNSKTPPVDLPLNDPARRLSMFAASDKLDLLLSAGGVTLGRKLAQGGGGQVFMGRFADQDVALKESYGMLLNNNNNELVREAAMMIKLNHHNIVRFFGIWQPEGTTRAEADRVFLVMEFCSGGDLRDAAQDPASTLKERQQWILQVASAITPPITPRALKT